MSRKGIYVEMAHHPQAILDAMDGMEDALASVQMRQKLARYGAVSMLVIGFVGFFLSLMTENAGLALPCFALAAIGVILMSLSSRWQIPMLQEHFDAARLILYVLRDDTGRKGRVVGWLDLSGPQQKEKTVRRARSGGGKQKIYYRDPWFKVKFKLADGNLLRLTLEDKVKVKAGSIVRHQSQFSAKLVANPNLYRLDSAPPSALPASRALLSHQDGVFVVKAGGPAKNLSARQVLETLKAVYGYLEPLGPGTAVAGMED